jgi:arylsulfatase A-like enzyme
MGSLVAASDIFDISGEPAKDVERYGNCRFGRDCLLARRLVEKGVSFVRVQHQNGLAWDKHRRAFESQRHITAEFDTAAGALIEDLIARGLWKRTLVVMMGEFGRTPEILGQGPPGRNHWAKSWSLSLGGCGINEGIVVGATNKNGTEVVERPITIHDLFCTFYKVLGIHPHKELEYEGRPLPLVEDKLGKPIAELV